MVCLLLTRASRALGLGQARGSLRHLEALLLSLRLGAMPQPLVLRLCRRLRLHSAAIAVYNAAGDYHSPVAQLMQVSSRW